MKQLHSKYEICTQKKKKKTKQLSKCAFGICKFAS